MKKRFIESHFFACALIVFLTAGIYGNSLRGDFVWDDRGIILDNTHYLKEGRNVFTSFTEPFFGKTPFYRPLLLVSFIVDYQLWGLNPFGYHLTNVVLHTLNAFLVYLLAFLLFRERIVALLSGLLFAAHPVQVEAVAWISGRNDVLLTLFSLLSVLLYLRWRCSLEGKWRPLCYLGFLLCYCSVLFTKESGIVVLLLFVLVDYFFRDELPHLPAKRSKTYLPLMLITALYIGARMAILGKTGMEIPGQDVISLFLTMAGTGAYYFKMLLFPLAQSASPVLPSLISFKDPACIPPLGLIASLVVITLLCRKRFRQLSFLILWVAVSLVPVSGIVPLTLPALEHRLYLGSVCFCMLVPLLFSKTLLSPAPGASFAGRSRWGLLIIAGLIFVYSTKTVARNTIWKDEYTFWSRTVHDSPSSLFAHNNLGIVYARAGEHREAVRIFKKALSLPHHEEGLGGARAKDTRIKLYGNLGLSYKALLEEELSPAGP